MSVQRTISNGSASSTSSTSSKVGKSRFPKRLYDMLENAERSGYAHVISWMPDGKSFKIHVYGSLNEEDEKAMVEILKRTFAQTRFKSFLRQLELYGSERIYKGPHRGECSHKLLVRGRLDLLQKTSKKTFQYEGKAKLKARAQANDNSPPCTYTCSTGSRCQYSKTSIIPTRLTNLDLADSESSVEQSDYFEYDDDDSSLII